MKNIRHVLFVCTGNSCRSVMAAAYLKRKLQENNIMIEVDSAGTLGIEGLAPTNETFHVLEEEGINPINNESKRITKELLNWADIILVMAPQHKERILAVLPGIEDKIKYLGEFNKLSSSDTIPDPIGRPLTFYRRIFNLIKNSIEGFMKWLKE